MIEISLAENEKKISSVFLYENEAKKLLSHLFDLLGKSRLIELDDKYVFEINGSVEVSKKIVRRDLGELFDINDLKTQIYKMFSDQIVYELDKLIEKLQEKENYRKKLLEESENEEKEVG